MRFSVIVPLYNKEPYVEKALRSVLSQTFKDYELIVVNDGSKDNSLEIAKRVLEGVENATITDQQNAGVSTARNNGIAAANGEYICFLDADDWWEPTFLEEMNDFIQVFPNAGLYSTNYYYIKHKKAIVKLDIPTGYYNYSREYANNLCQPVWTGAVCIRKSTFDEFGGFKKNIKLGEDFDLWIRIVLKYKTAFLNKPLSNYNQDVDITHRGTHHLHKPENHMLWNLGYLEEEEKTNPDYKQLIDNLRTYGLMPYFLSREYYSAAQSELAKVDWSRQSPKIRSEYSKPLFYLKAKDKFMATAARIKKIVIQTIR